MAMGAGRAEGPAAPRPRPSLPGEGVSAGGEEREELRGAWQHRASCGCQGDRSPEGSPLEGAERAGLQRPALVSGVVQCLPVCSFGVSPIFRETIPWDERPLSPILPRSYFFAGLSSERHKVESCTTVQRSQAQVLGQLRGS